MWTVDWWAKDYVSATFSVTISSCTERPVTTMVQCLLSSQNGVLTIHKPPCPPRPHRHVRRVVSDKTTSTPLADDCQSRASFLRLPPELRLPIYQYLLVTDNIAYPICPSTDGLRLVARRDDWKKPGLYPQILETCRLMNEEGTPILYGENMFYREYYGRNLRYQPISGSWRLSSRHLQCISRVHLHRQKFDVHRNIRVFDEFPSLKILEVTMDLNDLEITLDTWKDLMKVVGSRLHRLSRFDCEIRLPFDRAYSDWVFRTLARDFSLHEQWIGVFKAFIEVNGLLPAHRDLQWSHRTVTPDICGPECFVHFKIV